MASFQFNQGGKTLEEAVLKPRPNRDLELAKQPMPNYEYNPGSENGYPVAFWASWELNSRPRRIALLLDDAQEEYRPYAGGVVDNLVSLVNVFRGNKCPIAWTSWARFFDDGISNAMDRWYGPRGLQPEDPENELYIFTGKAGLEPLLELAPTQAERDAGWLYYTKMLDMFWLFRPDGKSYLDEKLKAEGVDTVVIAGLWTDECIVATAFGAYARGYDVVVVSDGVATATANQQNALTIINGTVAKVLPTKHIVSYMKNEFVLGEVGAVKGVMYQDGRKDPCFHCRL